MSNGFSKCEGARSTHSYAVVPFQGFDRQETSQSPLLTLLKVPTHFPIRGPQRNAAFPWC